MKKSQLEQLVKEQGEKIEKLGIIPKSREIAEKLGECKYVSEKWATANYMFVNESLRIDYQVYAMGEREIKIDYTRVDYKLHLKGYEEFDYTTELAWHRVFHAKERVASPPQMPNSLIVHDDRRIYEILQFNPDEWMRKLDILYSDINKILRQREDKKEKEEEAAKDPEVPESVLKDLQDRLGIRK